MFCSKRQLTASCKLHIGGEGSDRPKPEQPLERLPAPLPGHAQAETELCGCPSWIHIEPCVASQRQPSGRFWRISGNCASPRKTRFPSVVGVSSAGQPEFYSQPSPSLIHASRLFGDDPFCNPTTEVKPPWWAAAGCPVVGEQRCAGRTPPSRSLCRFLGRRCRRRRPLHGRAGSTDAWSSSACRPCGRGTANAPAAAFGHRDGSGAPFHHCRNRSSLLCECGPSLRAFMSSMMRWRNGLTVLVPSWATPVLSEVEHLDPQDRPPHKLPTIR
jgi:hypothetical protein